MSYGYFKKKNNYPHKDDEFLEALDTHYDTRSFIDIFDVNYFNIEDFIFTCERFIEEINDEYDLKYLKNLLEDLKDYQDNLNA